jgi:hypothetical protein
MAPKRPLASPSPDASTGSPGDPADPTAGEPGAVVPRVRRAVHDLRQPVQAMRLFVHLLSTRLERDEDRALVGKLDEALENIESALRGLMTSIAPGGAAAAPDEAPPTGD